LAGATKRFGWQGLSAEVPRDWDMSTTSGDHRRGYVCLTAEDGTAFEVRWERPRRAVDLQFLLSNYFREMAKIAGKKGLTMEKEIGPVIDLPPGADGSRKRAAAFEWQDRAAFSVGRAHVCRKCGRVVLAQVRSRASKKRTRETARDVFASLEDHPPARRCLWTIYDFAFELDESYRLSQKLLLAGLLTLEFVGDMCEVAVTRRGLADIALKEKKLQDVVVRNMFKREKPGRNWHIAEQTLKGHKAVLVEYRPRSLMARIREALGRMLPRGPRATRTLAWHCEPANRIFEVTFSGSATRARVLDDLIETITCHE